MMGGGVGALQNLMGGEGGGALQNLMGGGGGGIQNLMVGGGVGGMGEWHESIYGVSMGGLKRHS